MSRAAATIMGLIALFAPQSRVASAAPCPRSEAWLMSSAPISFDVAHIDTANHEPGGYLNARVTGDLLAGTATIVHGEIYPGETSITLRDAFDVMGVPVGTPVSITVEFVVDGMVTTAGCGGSGCGGGMLASVSADGVIDQLSDGATMFAPESRAFHLAPRLALTIVAGTPTTITYRLSGAHAPGGNHLVEAAGQLRFIDVPVGVGVLSCRGYVQSPTPAQPATWGGVKASYR